MSERSEQLSSSRAGACRQRLTGREIREPLRAVGATARLLCRHLFKWICYLRELISNALLQENRPEAAAQVNIYFQALCGLRADVLDMRKTAARCKPENVSRAGHAALPASGGCGKDLPSSHSPPCHAHLTSDPAERAPLPRWLLLQYWAAPPAGQVRGVGLADNQCNNIDEYNRLPRRTTPCCPTASGTSSGGRRRQQQPPLGSGPATSSSSSRSSK